MVRRVDLRGDLVVGAATGARELDRLSGASRGRSGLVSGLSSLTFEELRSGLSFSLDSPEGPGLPSKFSISSASVSAYASK